MTLKTSHKNTQKSDSKLSTPLSKNRQIMPLKLSFNNPYDKIMRLQRTIGNRAVGRLITSGLLSAKLRIGKPNDKYEKEADGVADQVMKMLDPQAALQTEEQFVTHTAPPVIQRTTPAQQVPSRFRLIQESLFIRSRSGATIQSWVNSSPGVPGTAEIIKTQFIAALRAYIQADPMNVGGTVPVRTTESDAETTALAVNQRICSRFPQITTSLSAASIRPAVGIIQASQTSSPAFIREWLANRLSLWTDSDNYNIRESDARYQQMMTDLLAHSYAGPNIRVLASRQAAFIDQSSGTRQIYLHHGADRSLRTKILIHELTHLYAHAQYKNWVAATTAERFYNEGFTEYLARKVMTGNELADRNNYQTNVDAITRNVEPYVSEDDIARAYFKGEVWRLEDRSAIARQMFSSQVGIQSGTSRFSEIAQSRSSPGINQIVSVGAHYRFMNLGINEHTPKPEHRSFFQTLYTTFIRPDQSTRLRFVGHASSPGSLSLNRALARRRSAAFYQMAQDVGVPVLRLIEAASPPHFGETTPTAEEADVQGRAFNRRAELFITRDTSAS